MSFESNEFAQRLRRRLAGEPDEPLPAGVPAPVVVLQAPVEPVPVVVKSIPGFKWQMSVTRDSDGLLTGATLTPVAVVEVPQ